MTRVLKQGQLKLSLLTFVLLIGAAIGAFGFSRAQPGARVTHQGFQNTLEKQIVDKEREGLDALKTGDTDHFGRLMARDAVFVDDHGPATRADVLQHVGGFKLLSYSMADVRFVPITARSGLIVYTITESGTSHGHKFSAKAYVSSLWEQRGNDWLCLFSQETGTK
jgi:hypothetical protein